MQINAFAVSDICKLLGNIVLVVLIPTLIVRHIVHRFRSQGDARQRSDLSVVWKLMWVLYLGLSLMFSGVLIEMLAE